MGDFYRTRFGLMPSLSRRGGSAEDTGGNGQSIFDMEQEANVRGRTGRENIAEYGEVLAPDIAQREGISLDEARSRLTDGTAQPEGPIHFLGRQTLGRIGLMDSQGPQGEEQGVRLSRLKGMIERRQIEAQDRAEASKQAKELAGMGGDVDDGEALGAATLSALRRSGATDLPGHMKFRRKDAANLIELYQRDPAAASAVAGLEHTARGSEGSKESQGERLTRMLADARRRHDTATEKAITDLYGKGANPRTTLEETEFNNFSRSPETQDALAAEEETARVNRKAGKKPQVGPVTRRHNMLRDAALAARAGNTRDTLYGGNEGGGADDGEDADSFLDGQGVPRFDEPRLQRRQ